MTTIQTFEDILTAMRENPVLRDAMRQHVRDEEFNARVLSDLAELKSDVGELKDGQARMEARQDRMEARQDRMEARQDRTEARQDRMEEDIAEIKASQARMETRQDRMDGQLSNLTGTSYERKIAKRAARTVRRYLDVRNAELVYSLANPESPHLSDLLYQATEDGVISDEQANDLEDADLILLGRSPDGEPTYVVVEVSITVDDSDIDRAARRARVVHTASGIPAQAAVIGTAISDANRQRADADGVAYITMAQ